MDPSESSEANALLAEDSMQERLSAEQIGPDRGIEPGAEATLQGATHLTAPQTIETPSAASTPPEGADSQTSEWRQRERDICNMDVSSCTVETLLKLYLELSSLYTKATASDSRRMRMAVAERLCTQGAVLENLDTLVVTWNVGNASPDASQLTHLIPCEERLYDIVIVGLQECEYDLTVDMQARAVEHSRRRHLERKEDRTIYEKRPSWNKKSNSSRFYRNDTATERDRSHSDSGSEDELLRGTAKALARRKRKSISRFFRHRASMAEKRAKRAITSRAGSHFAALIAAHLGEEDFFIVRECELMQMRLFVFARVEHRPRISYVEYASQATGIGGVVGNKGGLAVSMRFQDMRMCFISCHLAAHRKYVKERNQDCMEILRMVQRKLATRSASYLSDWDAVIILGDLNYRLGGDIGGNESILEQSNRQDNESAVFEVSTAQLIAPGLEIDMSALDSKTAQPKTDHTPEERQEIFGFIEREAWADLICKDQLRKEQTSGRVLMGFVEAEVYPFAPTFKVARTSERQYTESRLPAYCDRILWHTTPGQREDSYRIEQTRLFSPSAVSTSDHKPVCSEFKIHLKAPPKSLASQARARLIGLYLLPGLATDQRKHGMQICISKLHARNLLPMDIGGAADPYIVAYSTELFVPADKAYRPYYGASRTRVRFRQLNCTWQDVLLIKCPPHLSRPEDLLGKHFTLALWDFDTLSSDDHMGEVVISLDDAVQAFLGTKAVLSEHFENAGRDAVMSETTAAATPSAITQPREPHTGLTQYLSRPELFESKLADGSLSELGNRQFAFDFPVVRNGKAAGALSGVVTLFRPTDRLKVPQLQTAGWSWKCVAYAERRD